MRAVSSSGVASDDIYAFLGGDSSLRVNEEVEEEEMLPIRGGGDMRPTQILIIRGREILHRMH